MPPCTEDANTHVLLPTNTYWLGSHSLPRNDMGVMVCVDDNRNRGRRDLDSLDMKPAFLVSRPTGDGRSGRDGRSNPTDTRGILPKKANASINTGRRDRRHIGCWTLSPLAPGNRENSTHLRILGDTYLSTHPAEDAVRG